MFGKNAIKYGTFAIILLVLCVMVFTFVNKVANESPKQSVNSDRDAAYRVYLEKDPHAPLFNETYYCTYYSLDDRHLVLYDADSTIILDIVLNMNTTCSVMKIR